MPHRIFRNRALSALLASALAALVALVALGWTLVFRSQTTETFRTQTYVNCVEVEKVKTQIRGVFEEGLTTSQRRYELGEIDGSQWNAIRDYYGRQLGRFSANECKRP